GADETSQLVGAGSDFFRIEYALGKAAEKSRRAVFQNVAAWAEDRCTGSDCLTDTDEIVLVASRTVKDEKRLPGCRVSSGLEAVDEAEIFRHALGPRSSRGMRMFGRSASISKRRGSSHSGSLSDWPRTSAGSSTAKPGESVAISKSTPPGSRK